MSIDICRLIDMIRINKERERERVAPQGFRKIQKNDSFLVFSVGFVCTSGQFF